MREHDYIFLGFTALMGVMVMASRYVALKRSPFHRKITSSISKEFVINFFKVIKPAGTLVLVISAVFLIGGIDAAIKSFLFFGLIALTISLSFALYKLFRYKEAYSEGAGGGSALILVVIYVVFALGYISSFFRENHVL